VGDQAASQLEERFVDVGSAFPADAKSSEAVQPGEGAFNYASVGAQSAAVPGTAAGNGRHDAADADLIAVAVVVVATVDEEGVGLAAGVPDAASDRRGRVQQGHELGDVIAVAAGEDDRERGAVPIGDQVVLRACPAAVDRRRACVEPPFTART
jgi:hypothetical protein